MDTSPTYVLRPYQKEAVETLVSKRDPGGWILALPVGGGKSLIIAEATRQLNLPTLVICPSQEILKQDRDKLLEYVDKNEIGTYSASLRSKVIKKFTLCTLGSVYRKPELFSHFGLIIIDECDLIPEKGMFSKFRSKMYLLNGNDNLRVFGFTASPWRMNPVKKFYGRVMRMETSIKMLTDYPFWKDIIYSIDHWTLVKAGYITPLKVIQEIPLVPFEQLKENGSDFSMRQYNWQVSRSEIEVIRQIERARDKYNRILVFCCGIEQAERLAPLIFGSEIVTSKTPAKDRTRIVDGFKLGTPKIVLNVGVLTMGFDLPELDLIILVRPTKSLRLYYQICGRAVRKSDSKIYGTLVDLTGTTKYLGRIESIQLKKVNDRWHIFTSSGQMDGKLLYSYEKEI